MTNIYNDKTDLNTNLDLNLIDEIYQSLYYTFGKQFWKRISSRWKPNKTDEIIDSPHYCSAMYDSTNKECLVLFSPGHLFRFHYNPSLEESFLTFIHQITKFTKNSPTLSNRDILIIFPSLSFVPPIQQICTVYTLSKEYGKTFSHSFKTYDKSLNAKEYSFRQIAFPLSKQGKIHILGLFEFFSCTNFDSLSKSPLANSLTNKLSKRNTQHNTIPPISFLLKFRTFIKCFTKEIEKNLKVKNILLYKNLFEYTLKLNHRITKKEPNLWAFNDISSYLIMQKISLSGLLIQNSLGSAPWLSPHTSCESLPQLKKYWSQGPFYHYDVNSLYPYIMAEFALPTGRPIINTLKKTYENPKDLLKEDFKDFFGFVQIDIIIKELSPHLEEDFFKHPTLPYQIQTYSNEIRTIFPTGRLRGVFFFAELEHLIHIGFVEKITIYRTFQYQKDKVFQKLMNFLYPLRNPEKSPYSHNIIKFIMNSFYGNLSINPFKLTKLEIHGNTQALDQIQDYYRPSNLPPNFVIARSKKFDQYALNKRSFDFIKESGNPENLEDFNKFIRTQLPHVAAAITSYGRLFLAKIIYNHKLPIILCNTDSLITNKELPRHLICKKTMGKFKLEATYQNIYVKSINQYIVENENKQRFKIGNFSHFETTLMQDTSEFLYNEMKTIFTKESTYIEKSLRRTPIFNKDNIPLNWTFPIKI